MKHRVENIKRVLKTLMGTMLIAMVLSLPMAAFAQEASPTQNSTNTNESSQSTSSSSSTKSVKNIIIIDSNNSCHEEGNTLDDYVKGVQGDTKSYIAVELSEPISSVNQEITSGNLTVSEVVWKFNCEIWAEEIIYDNGDTDEIYYNSSQHPEITEQRNVNLYRPYKSGCPSGSSCALIQIIAGTSGAGLIKTYITIMYRWAASIVGIIAVLVMVVSGIQISVDQGGGDNVTAAKTRIFQSLSALVILFLSSLILYTINPTFFTK